MNKFFYTGDELETFKLAKNWKNYYLYKIRKSSITGPVLEVGSGIGEITKKFKYIWSKSFWVCLEPDKNNSKKIQSLITQKVLSEKVSIFCGFLSDLRNKKLFFNSILFIDSLEHIENDHKALKDADKLLKKDGKLVVIVPAHNFLYNEFDRSIGHFRRYNKEMLKNVLPKNHKLISLQYIDSVGFFLSLGNKYLLKSSNPTSKQVLFWDRVIVPISFILDKLLFHTFGKNLIMFSTKK